MKHVKLETHEAKQLTQLRYHGAAEREKQYHGNGEPEKQYDGAAEPEKQYHGAEWENRSRRCNVVQPGSVVLLPQSLTFQTHNQTNFSEDEV